MSESDQEHSQNGRAAGQSEYRQPEYGQIAQPEYGALLSQFPPNYDPYAYGRPEEPKPEQAAQNTQAQSPQAAGWAGMPAPYGNGQQPGNAAGGPATQGGASGNGNGAYPYNANGVNGGNPQGFGGNGFGPNGGNPHGIDPNDPQRNPLYGRWDPYAIVAFVLAFFLPLLPALLGAAAMWRTRTFHMKGFGLGLAAVIINVLSVLFSLWMMSQGITADEILQWSQGQMDNAPGQQAMALLPI